MTSAEVAGLVKSREEQLRNLFRRNWRSQSGSMCRNVGASWRKLEPCPGAGLGEDVVCEEEGEESTHWLGHQGCRGHGGLPPPEASSPLVSHCLGSVEPFFFFKFPSSVPIVYGLKPLLCPLELPTHHQEDLHPHPFLQMALLPVALTEPACPQDTAFSSVLCVCLPWPGAAGSGGPGSTVFDAHGCVRNLTASDDLSQLPIFFPILSDPWAVLPHFFKILAPNLKSLLSTAVTWIISDFSILPISQPLGSPPVSRTLHSSCPAPGLLQPPPGQPLPVLHSPLPASAQFCCGFLTRGSFP